MWYTMTVRWLWHVSGINITSNLESKDCRYRPYTRPSW